MRFGDREYGTELSHAVNSADRNRYLRARNNASNVVSVRDIALTLTSALTHTRALACV